MHSVDDDASSPSSTAAAGSTSIHTTASRVDNGVVIGGGSGATRVLRVLRKRPRLACMEEPLHRHVYEMMVRQLHYDGYTDAAAAVAASSGIIVPGLSTGNYSLAGSPSISSAGCYASSCGGVGDRLMRLVSNGLALESTQALELDTFLTREVVERHIASSKLYLPFCLTAQSTVGRTAFSMRERFVTSSLGGVPRSVAFSPDGSLVACGGTNGLANIFSLKTLSDLTALEEVRQDLQWSRLSGGLQQRSSHSKSGANSSGNRSTPAVPASSMSASNNASNVITELAEVRRFTEHQQSVEVVRFHETQPYLLTGGIDGDLYLRDYANPASTVLMHHHDAYPIRSACFHPGSSTSTDAASVSQAVSSTGGISGAEYLLYVTDHVAPRLLHVESQRVMMPLAYNNSNNSGTGSSSANSKGHGGKSQQVGSSSGADVTSTGGWRVLHNTHPHTAALCDVDIARDGRCFATASMDGSFALHDAVSGKTVLRAVTAHSGVPVTSVVFSRTGNVLLTSGMDSTARLWDLRKVRCTWGADVVAAAAAAAMKLNRTGADQKKEAEEEEENEKGEDENEDSKEQTRTADNAKESEIEIKESAQRNNDTAATTTTTHESNRMKRPRQGMNNNSNNNRTNNNNNSNSSGNTGGGGWISSGNLTELMSFGEPMKCPHRSMRAVFNSHESHIWCHNASLFALHSYHVLTGDISQSLVVSQHVQRGFAAAPFSNVVVSGSDDSRLRLWTMSMMPPS